MTWNGWIVYHGNLFAMTGPSEAAMLVDWADLFNQEGYDPEELKAASAKMAMGDGKLFRGEHIQRLTEIAKESRREKEVRRVQDDKASCVLCGGCGFVSVPGACCLTAGGNTIPPQSTTTVAVFCSCSKGTWIHRTYRGKVPMRTLQDYQEQFPNWKSEMDKFRELARKRADLVHKACGKTMDQGLRSVFEKYIRQPGSEGD